MTPAHAPAAARGAVQTLGGKETLVLFYLDYHELTNEQ